MERTNPNFITRPNDLEVSLFTLWSLYILIDQHYKALLSYRGLLNKEVDLENDNDVSLDTIREALEYQILLKVCAFQDEWDQVFGIKTEGCFHEQGLKVKLICKKARRLSNRWKGLRDFRNQAIAHNHRDRNGNNIYYTQKVFHTPLSLGESGLMIYAIEKMVKIAAAIFPEAWENITRNIESDFSVNPDFQMLSRADMLQIISEVENDIDCKLKEFEIDIPDISSDYADFLRIAP